MKKLIMTLGSVIILLTFCSCANKPLSKIDFSKGDYKLYFFYQPIDSALTSPTKEISEFQKKYRNFYITDKNALEVIKGKVIQDKALESKTSNSFYMLRLECDGKVLDGGILDIENNAIIYYYGKYKFDFNELEKLHSKFIKLNSFVVNCTTISNTNKLIKHVESTKGFMYFGTEDGENPLKGFQGKVDLITDVKQSDFSGKFEKTKKKFEADFKEIGKAKLFNGLYEGGDSMKISMLWEKDFTSKLPKKYKVLKAYSDSINFPVNIYDIEKRELIDFFDKEKVTDYKIKELE